MKYYLLFHWMFQHKLISAYFQYQVSLSEIINVHDSSTGTITIRNPNIRAEKPAKKSVCINSLNLDIKILHFTPEFVNFKAFMIN